MPEGVSMNQYPVKLIYHIDYWDGPLSGVCEINGRRLMFKCIHDYHDVPNWRIFKVFDLTPEEWADEDYRHKLFVENVGSHTSYDSNDSRIFEPTQPQTQWDVYHKESKKIKTPNYDSKEILGYFDSDEMLSRDTKFRSYFIEGDQAIGSHAVGCEYYDIVTWSKSAQFYDYGKSKDGKHAGWSVSSDSAPKDRLGVKFCPNCGKKMPRNVKQMLNGGSDAQA